MGCGKVFICVLKRICGFCESLLMLFLVVLTQCYFDLMNRYSPV